MGAKLAHATDAKLVQSSLACCILPAGRHTASQLNLQALLFGRQVSCVYARSAQFGALLAHLRFLALKLAGSAGQSSLRLLILAVESWHLLPGLLDGTLEIVNTLACLEVCGAGGLCALLSFLQRIDAAQWLFNRANHLLILAPEASNAFSRLINIRREAQLNISAHVFIPSGSA
ncbi:hypothetical protein QM298_14015 [Pseudomonas mendocina]|nr:hypothetical protein [Pseudomonas mendocina]MDV5861994.1 hypothetical protein [Pseudomonas mendocina]